MIAYDLRCGNNHVFEAWFGNSADYDTQRAAGQLACPLCDDLDVRKAAMAPAVPRKGGGSDDPRARLAELLAAQRRIEAQSDYVGTGFAAEARAIHDGEAPQRAIHGEATVAEARALADDGVPVAPLPFRPLARADA